MNFLSEFFIGSLLKSESNVLKKANIRLVFSIVLISIFLLMLACIVYVLNELYYQLLKSSITLVLFIGVLFYIKIKKTVLLASHAIILIALVNVLVNVFLLYQSFNAYSAMLVVTDIIFAFHLLGSRWGMFYATCQCLLILVHETGIHAGIVFTTAETQQLGAGETFVRLILVFIIVTYLIYYYHQAFELAKNSLYENMEELRKSKELAEEMNRLKTNFLSNMSHEIRTPINGILGISQVIEMETQDESILEYVRLQQQSGKRLLDTITSILNLSRIEAGKDRLMLNVIDVNSIIKNNIKPLEELAKGKALSFTLNFSGEQLLCLSDDTMFFQIINNVVGNAIKFTDHGSVVVTTRHDRHKPQMISIVVEDTGIGIAPDFLNKVFNTFEQESSGITRHYEGNGLGLSISKKYIELMGGEIFVSSIKGQGSSFTILLPLYQPA